MLLLLLSAVLHGAAITAQISSEVEAVPMGDPAEWITANDYPHDARKRGEQGRVVVRLAVGHNGRPSACTIIESSGSASLDSQTCSLLIRRARFLPPIDAAGAPASSTYEEAFRWALASTDIVSGPQISYTLKVDVDEKGLVEECEILEFRMFVSEGQTGRNIDPCPPIGSRFTRDFVVRDSSKKRSFVITESVAQTAN